MSIPNIAATHDGAMSQRMVAHFAPTGNMATAGNPATASNPAAAGNPTFTTIMPANPNVTPNPTIQQIQTIQKAVKMLNNHQLLMKFATENKQSIPAARLYWEKIATAQLT